MEIRSLKVIMLIVFVALSQVDYASQAGSAGSKPAKPTMHCPIEFSPSELLPITTCHCPHHKNHNNDCFVINGQETQQKNLHAAQQVIQACAKVLTTHEQYLAALRALQDQQAAAKAAQLQELYKIIEIELGYLSTPEDKEKIAKLKEYLAKL